MTGTILWDAEQVCSDCGEGAFRMILGYGPTCTVCEHVHPMDPWNLGEGESFEWIAGTLHVVARIPEDV